MKVFHVPVNRTLVWSIWLAGLVGISSLHGAEIGLSQGAERTPVPVMVGEVEDLDACLGFGTVKDLKHSLLAVRSGPGSDYPQRDELANGRQVFVCSSSEDGVWLGVVYAEPNTEQDCAVSSPLPAPKAYAGPCRSGWVHHRWLDTGE